MELGRAQARLLAFWKGYTPPPVVRAEKAGLLL